MSTTPQFDIITIGGGIGGSAAALRAAQNNMRTLLVTGSKDAHIRSRSQWVMNVDNMITVHEGLIRNQLLATLRTGGDSQGVALIEAQHYHIPNRLIIKNTRARLTKHYPDQVTILDADCQAVRIVDGGFTVEVDALTYQAPAVVLATGIMDEQPKIQIHDRHGNLIESTRPIYPFANRESVLYCIRCEGHLTRADAVAVFGSSDTAAEVAFMLHERYDNAVYILTNGAEPALSDGNRTLCDAYGIELVPQRITDFVRGDVGELCAIAFHGHPEIEVRFALVVLGTYQVYNELARQLGVKLLDDELPPQQRQIAIDSRGETSVPNFFAVGDAARRTDEPTMKQIYTAQEYAVRAVDSIDYRRRLRMREQALAA
ncbi:MAG: NAD(P)/FAD-dependent oxidoreductase [Candidatus Marinimicrobia bacterium]|nr:NAD(P)/FAD-dependent oxidoreductase [Candidatus Neomarinimicrobiota bacterium]